MAATRSRAAAIAQSAHGRCRIRSVDKLDNVDAEQRRYRRPADVTRLGGGTGLIVAFRKNWPFSTHPDSPAERTRIQLPFVSPICTGVSGPIVTTVREPELAALRTLTQPRTVALLQRTVAGRAGVVRRATGGGLGVAFATARGGGAAAIGAGAEGGGAATGGATTGVVSTGAETGCASDGAGDSSCVAPVDAVPVTESPLVATFETESERAESMVVAATFAESVLRSVYAGTTTTAAPSGFESAIAGVAMGVDFAHHAPHTRPQNASVAAVPQTTARNGNVAGAVPHRIHFPFFRG